jgi:hypothetical protein
LAVDAARLQVAGRAATRKRKEERSREADAPRRKRGHGERDDASPRRSRPAVAEGEGALDAALAVLVVPGHDDRAGMLREALGDLKTRMGSKRRPFKSVAGVPASRSGEVADDAEKSKRDVQKGKGRKRSRSRRRRSPSPLAAASVSENYDDSDDGWKESFASKRDRFRRLAAVQPGRPLESPLVQYLERLSSGFGDVRDDKLLGIMVRYLLAAWILQNQKLLSEDRFREVRTLAEWIDLALRGRIPGALDVLAQRFKACLLSARDGHSRASRWLELIPTEAAGSGTSAVEKEIARRLETRDLKLKALVTKTKSG